MSPVIRQMRKTDPTYTKTLHYVAGICGRTQKNRILFKKEDLFTF
jgi:hypothetical protein